MSISKVSNKWLNRLYKSVAILLVFFAVLISSLRLYLPYAHNHRQDLQDYINETYNSHFIIGSLNMVWQGSGPSLVAENVSLLQTDAAEVFIENIDFHIDFWRSLLDRKIVTKDLTLEGVKVYLDREMLSSPDISQQDSSLINNVSELFLNHIGQFSLQNSQVIILNGQQQKTFLVEELSWLNQQDKHYAQGNVIVDGLISNTVKMQLAIEGETINELSGQLYVKGSQLDITPWLDKVLAVAPDNVDSSINFDAWLTLSEGKARSATWQFSESQISWDVAQQKEQLVISDGTVAFNFIPSFKQVNFASGDFKVLQSGSHWPEFSFRGFARQDALGVNLSTLDISAAIELLPLVLTSSEQRQLLADLDMSGELSDVHYTQHGENYRAAASLVGFSNRQVGDIPGINNADLSFVVRDGIFAANLSAENGQLDFGSLFNRPIPYESINSKIDGVIGEDGWRVNVDELLLSSSELQLDASFQLNKHQQEPLKMALLASILNGDVQYANHYYPEELMGEDLVNYLNKALVKGQLTQANVVINGPLNKFPFINNEGVFVVDAELTDGTFRFDEQWPAISAFDANLNFTNDSMLITARQGVLSGLDVEGVTASIDSLSVEQVLAVNAVFEQEKPSSVAGLMNASPLADSVGVTLEELNIQGDIEGVFDLILPLNDSEAVVAKGDVKLNKNQILLSAPEMHFKEVNGLVSFVNDKVTTQGLALNWRGLPLKAEVLGYEQEDAYLTTIDLQANWQKQHWLPQVPETLQAYFDSSIDWQGKLTLTNKVDGSFNYLLDINSDLVGSTLNLPAPFNKTADEERNLTVSVKGDERNSIISAVVGSELNFYGELNHQTINFTNAHLVLGHEHMFIPSAGFFITAKLPQADVIQWEAFVSDLLTATEQVPEVESQKPLLDIPTKIIGKIDELTVGELIFNDANLDLTHQSIGWQLELNAKETRADITFYPDWYAQGIAINADYIKLPEEETADKENADKEAPKPTLAQLKEQIQKSFDFDKQLFENLPPIVLSCKQCQVGKLNLGEIDAQLIRSKDNEVNLNRFIAKKGKSEINLTGSWHFDNEQSYSTLSGKIGIDKVERELENLGMASIIKDSGIAIVLDVNWLGGPHQFSIASLNGQLSSHLNDGYLADVPDGARIFSVLSLQSLVRKLTLDFRDIFSDGMFYTEIKGDMSIKDGVLYTQNTKMKGAAGDLVMEGNTVLTDGVLDYRMKYKPNLTSSLPVLAWIATLNPVTFLAGVAIDEVFTSKVVSEFEFELTGNVDDPNLRVVNKKTQDVSVGRSTPPQFVDSGKKVDESNDKKDVLKEGINDG